MALIDLKSSVFKHKLYNTWYKEIRKLEEILSLVSLVLVTPVAGHSSLLSKVSHEQVSSECRGD